MIVPVLNLWLLLMQQFNPAVFQQMVNNGAQIEQCVNLDTHEILPMSACHQ